PGSSVLHTGHPTGHDHDLTDPESTRRPKSIDSRSIAFYAEVMTQATHTPGTGQTLPGHTRTLIIGAGFGGLGAAIRLDQAGQTDFLVVARGEEVGGTWRDNTYPGAACDVPSQLYSFSFAPNREWSRSFSGQPEIQDYIRTV